MTEVSRRRLLGYSGATLAAGAAAGAGLVSVAQAHEGPSSGNGPVPFFGAHQAGIATPVQDRLHFASFDVVTDDRDRLIRMLKEWTAAGAALTAGHPYGSAAGGLPESPPDDTGEAL
ncbi:Dyp-type peroxidase domain-containing protein, partial [Actinoallomurus bryophytorum]